VGTGVRKKLLALLIEDVDLKAEEMNVAFAIGDGGPRYVGLVRKSTKESDWRDVLLIDSVRKTFERQLARRRDQTGQEPRPGECIFARVTPTGRSQSGRTR
jgi:hypothetical protein